MDVRSTPTSPPTQAMCPLLHHLGLLASPSTNVLQYYNVFMPRAIVRPPLFLLIDLTDLYPSSFSSFLMEPFATKKTLDPNLNLRIHWLCCHMFNSPRWQLILLAIAHSTASLELKTFRFLFMELVNFYYGPLQPTPLTAFLHLLSILRILYEAVKLIVAYIMLICWSLIWFM